MPGVTIKMKDNSGGTKRATKVTPMGKGSRSPRNILKRGLRQIATSTTARKLNTKKYKARQVQINKKKQQVSESKAREAKQ
jgi:hypothetical protein